MTVDTIEHCAPAVIRYRTVGGAIVRVIEVERKTNNPDMWDFTFVGQCAGCFDTKGSTRDPLEIGPARTWAAKHASECRALPQVIGRAQSVDAIYLGEAHSLIERARSLSSRNSSNEDKARAVQLVTVAEGMLAHALAVHRIEGV